jgi:hypothetical protein
MALYIIDLNIKISLKLLRLIIIRHCYEIQVKIHFNNFSYIAK